MACQAFRKSSACLSGFSAVAGQIGVRTDDTGRWGATMGSADDADPTSEGTTMKTTIKHITPLLAAAAIGAISLVPVASAASNSTPASHSACPPSCASPQAPYTAGVGPLLPAGTDPYVPYFPGMLSLVS